MPRRLRKLVSERKGMEGSFWKAPFPSPVRMQYSWRPVRPETLSPFLKFGWRDSMISARPKARMTSPIWTGGMYWGKSAIQTRMVGSMERYFTLARAWPSEIVGLGDSVSLRTSGVIRPVGRWARSHRRLVVGIEEEERRGWRPSGVGGWQRGGVEEEWEGSKKRRKGERKKKIKRTDQVGVTAVR